MRKKDPDHDPLRARWEPPASLWRRPQRSRLALRRRPLSWLASGERARPIRRNVLPRRRDGTAQHRTCRPYLRKPRRAAAAAGRTLICRSDRLRNRPARPRPTYAINGTKAQLHLGYKAETSLAQGLRETIRSIVE